MALVLSYTPAGSYTNAPTLAQAINDLRQDLFDRTQNLPAGTPQRWADDDLTRALDRAVDEYSFVAPLIQAVMTATLPQTRFYALPPGAWWVESVEYPTGEWPIQYVSFEDNIVTPSLGAPGATTAAAGTSPGLTGSYQWTVTFLKSGGETLAGVASAPLALAGQGGSLTIPTGPPGTVGRNVYRSKNSGAYGYVGQVLDNLTTSYIDTLADGSVGAPPPAAGGGQHGQPATVYAQALAVPDATGHQRHHHRDLRRQASAQHGGHQYPGATPRHHYAWRRGLRHAGLPGAQQ